MAKKEFEQEPMLEETSGEMMLEETSDDSTMLEESSTDVILEETSTSPKTQAVKEDTQKAKEAEKKVEDAGKRKVERETRKEAEEAEKKRETAAAKKKAEEAARRKTAQEAEKREERRRERRREEEKEKKAEKNKYIWKVIGLHIAGFLLAAIFDYIYSLFDSDSGFSWKTTLAIFLFFAIILNYSVFNDQRKEGHVFQSVLHFCIGTVMLLVAGLWTWNYIKSALPPSEKELKTELMARYDSIYSVGKDELRIVEKNGKKGMVDKRGNEKFPPLYDEILEPLEKEELITVKRDEKEEIQSRILTSRIVISSGKKGLLLTGEKIGDDVSNLCCDTRFKPQYDSIYYDAESKQWRANQY